MIMEMEKMKAFDAMNLEFGLTEEDISRAVREYDLTNQPEFASMMAILEEKAKELN